MIDNERQQYIITNDLNIRSILSAVFVREDEGEEEEELNEVAERLTKMADEIPFVRPDIETDGISGKFPFPFTEDLMPLNVTPQSVRPPGNHPRCQSEGQIVHTSTSLFFFLHKMRMRTWRR